jgi:hypothetical protein
VLITPEAHLALLNAQSIQNVKLIYNYMEVEQVNPFLAMIDPNYVPKKVKVKITGTVFQARVLKLDKVNKKVEDIQFLITNAHVCGKNKTMFVENRVLPEEVEVLAIDEVKDLCLLKPLKASITAFLLSDLSYDYQTVYTAGYPHGKNLRVYKGETVGYFEGYVDTTLTVAPGQSGSPVFNPIGLIVGVVSATDTRTGEGLIIDALSLWRFVDENLSKLK